MKVYVCEIEDRGVRPNAAYCYGLDFEEGKGYAYDLCMSEMQHMDKKRYEFFNTERDIDFQWEMTPERFDMIRHPPEEWTAENYIGSLYFGNCKLEFCLLQDVGINYVYCNLFVRNRDGYGTLDDGVPYDSYEGFAAQIESDIPKRRTFEAFAEKIERSVVESLTEYHQLINDALEPTDPDKWYSMQHKPVQVTRRA